MRRPLRVTLFALALIGLAAWYGLRLLEAVLFRKILGEFGAHPGPLYIGASGAFWLAFGAVLARAWLRGDAWGWPGAIGFILGYELWYWLDRLQAQGPRPTLPFALAASGILLLLAGACLFSRRTVRFFHREAHERKSENPAAS